VKRTRHVGKLCTLIYETSTDTLLGGVTNYGRIVKDNITASVCIIKPQVL
jgi:hypothetical protein